MSDDEKAFLAAICADPEDTGLRLIFADWLDERVDPRGEFIRVQCDLRHLPAGDSHRQAIKAREWRLLQQHGEEWEAPLRQFGSTQITFHCGLPDKITISARDFLRNAEALFACGPLRAATIRLTNLEDLADLASCPYLSNLATLDLIHNNIGPEGARALSHSPYLVNLRTLSLSGNPLGNEGARALAESPHLVNLTTLQLSMSNIEAEGARALAGPSSHLRNLNTLYLGVNRIGDEGTLALATSPNLGNLRGLSLSSNHVGPAGAQALADSPHLFNLTTLDLSYNLIGNEGARALARAPNLQRLTKLGLRDNDIGPEVRRDVEQALRARQAREYASRGGSGRGR